ncbi:MAG: metallophosphoesterase family protein [Bryobacteraceae bacterium]
MRYLILSDIHANWEGLQAVLGRAGGLYEQILCCGDLVGYGADPNAVVAWTRENAAGVIRGNHDKACAGLEDLEWFNPVARAAAIWTQNELTAGNLEYVRDLAKGPLAVNGFELVHGSPLDEDEYVIGTGDASQALAYLNCPITFFGHTHVQGGFCWTRSQVEVIEKPSSATEHLQIQLRPEDLYLLNPGSVGQPRDGDVRAGFAIYEPENGTLTYHRVPYDVETAQEKIIRAGLPPLLAKRLGLGR